MDFLNAFHRWRAYRRTRRRWRDTRTILVLVLICALCNFIGIACSLFAYALQQIGILMPASALIL